MLITESRREAYDSLAAFLSPATINRLAAIGITTLGELSDQWTYGNRLLLTRYVPELRRKPPGTPAAAQSHLLVARSPRTGEVVTRRLRQERPAPPKRHPRGVPLTLAQKRTPAPHPVPLAASPTKAAQKAGAFRSLAAHFPAIRNQGERSTCVAFATVAWAEYQLAKATERNVRLSEQFAYWACKQDDGWPRSKGTFVGTARLVTRNRGICRHALWPYAPVKVRAGESQGPPPPGAREDARKYRVATARIVSARDPRKLRACIDAGLPVVVSVRTFTSWDFDQTRISGEIPLPLPGDRPDGGHAVLIVGYERNAALPGGGAFIFRNSWGTGWGTRCRFGAGHGTLPFGYLKANGLEAFA